MPAEEWSLYLRVGFICAGVDVDEYAFTYKSVCMQVYCGWTSMKTIEIKQTTEKRKYQVLLC